MSTGKVLLGVLAGVAAGALIGILFAPAKGSETRKKFSKKGDDFAETMKEKFNEFINSVSEKFEAGKEEAENARDHSSAKEGKQETNPA